MAEVILRRRFAELGLGDAVRVLSGGVRAGEGYPASALASDLLCERGMSLADHRSQPVTPAMLRQADLVLVMEDQHRTTLFYWWPEHVGKIYLLSETAGKQHDIEDPYGGSPEEYAATADELESLLEQGMPFILKRLRLSAPGDTSAA